MSDHTPGTRVGDYVTTATPVGSKVAINKAFWRDAPEPSLEVLAHRKGMCYIVGKAYPKFQDNEQVYTSPSGWDFYIVKKLPAKDTK
jgi:hypothetical protein